MWSTYGDSKIRLYLAKADEAGGDKDRQKVLMQIVQELCKRPGINRTGFDMPAIYIPPIYSSDIFNKKGPRCANQIDETCKEIDRAVGMNVQNALDNLKKDCQGLLKKLERKLMDDSDAKARNSVRSRTQMMRFFITILLVSFFGFCSAAANGFLDKIIYKNSNVGIMLLAVGVSI